MLLVCSGNAIAQNINKKQVVDTLCAALVNNYVYLDTTKQMCSYIKQRLNDGAYNQTNTPSAFAQMLTEDLRHVYNDAHMAVNYSPPAKGTAPPQNNRAAAAQENFGFRKLEILGGNIGYLAFDRFPGLNDDSRETADAAFTFLKNVNALVIDLRNNGGGSPDMDKYISSFFLPAGTLLSGLYERRTNTFEQRRTDAVRLSFGAKPVYVLTSRHTFSAAEGFAYDMQNLHRVTVIGETTGGGAHAVEPQNISNGFIGLIPYAREVSPITGTNWEGTGVKPDIAIAADSALDAAVLGYYNYQLANTSDSAQIKNISWARDMLLARLHPYPVDTVLEKKIYWYLRQQSNYVGSWCIFLYWY